MADRRIITLNPLGFNENLQSSDRLLVESPSSFRSADFSEDVTFPNATASGNITINGTPTANKHAVTVEYVANSISDVTLTASTPINLVNKDISIDNATESAVGAMRFATDLEVAALAEVEAAVQPYQLPALLDAVSITGTYPIDVTESSRGQFVVSVSEATSTSTGVIQIAADPQIITGTDETVAVNPKQLQDKFNSIPEGTTVVKGLVRFATAQEAQAGTENDAAVTPAELKSYVDQIDIETTQPLTDTKNGNTFSLNVNDATQITRGVIRIATTDEITAGESNTTAVTPAQLYTQLGGITIVDATTTEKGIIKLATNNEVYEGTVDNEAVTPASLRYALDQDDYLLDGGVYAS